MALGGIIGGPVSMHKIKDSEPVSSSKVLPSNFSGDRTGPSNFLFDVLRWLWTRFA